MLTTLDHMLGTQAKVRLLRALAALTSPVSGREAQRLARVRSVSGAGRALADLTDLGILSRDETSGSHLYRVNRSHALAPYILALFDAEEMQWGILREALAEGLRAADLAEAVCSVVIFGSTARGDAHPGSDLDLLVIVKDADDVGSVRRAILAVDPALRERLGLRASPYVLARADAAARTSDGDPLMAAVRTEGRTLLGDSFAEVLAAW